MTSTLVNPISRRSLWTAAGLVTVWMWLLAFFTPRDFPVGPFGDDAHYAVLAKSLREHHAYRTINLPGEPPETKYPPGLPLVFAALWSPQHTDAENLDRLRWVNLVLVGPLAGLLTMLGITTIGLAPTVAAGIAIGSLLNPATMVLWTIPLSEAPLLILVSSGILLAARGKTRASVVALLAAIYFRSVASVFLVATLVLGWKTRHPLRKSNTVLALVGLAPWLAWQAVNGSAVPNIILGNYGSYGRWYLDSLFADPITILFRVPLANASDAFFALGTSLLRREWLHWSIEYVVAITTGIAIVWLVWKSRRHVPALALGLGLYFLMVLAWPFESWRFVAGVWPLVLICVAAWHPRRVGPWLAVLVLITGGIGFAKDKAVMSHRMRGRVSNAFVTVLRAHVPSDRVIATANSPLHYLLLGNQAVPNQRMESYRGYRGDLQAAWGTADDVLDILNYYQPGYVTVERRGLEGRFGVEELVERCPSAVVRVWSSVHRDFLYRVDDIASCGK